MTSDPEALIEKLVAIGGRMHEFQRFGSDPDIDLTRSEREQVTAYEAALGDRLKRVLLGTIADDPGDVSEACDILNYHVRKLCWQSLDDRPGQWPEPPYRELSARVADVGEIDRLLVAAIERNPDWPQLLDLLNACWSYIDEAVSLQFRHTDGRPYDYWRLQAETKFLEALRDESAVRIPAHRHIWIWAKTLYVRVGQEDPATGLMRFSAVPDPERGVRSAFECHIRRDGQEQLQCTLPAGSMMLFDRLDEWFGRPELAGVHFAASVNTGGSQIGIIDHGSPLGVYVQWRKTPRG